MDKTDKNTIEELLPRYCEGLATEEERLQVETWMDESEENRRMAKQIHALYLATDTVHIMTKVDTQKALTKVKSRMTGNRQRKTTWWEWAQRAAAVLFIPLLVTLMVQHWGGSEQELAQIMEVKTNPGMMTSLTLPDGTLVFLNSESTLSYPSRFDGDTRNVTLQGEAYFEVAKSDRPFIVRTYGAQVRVYGTRFDVNSYDTEKIRVVLVDGKVGVSTEDFEEVMLEPAQLALINAEKGITVKKEINPAYYIAWQNGYFAFDNERLEDILSVLARWYNFEVLYARPEIRDIHFTASLWKDQPLEHILKQFEKTQSISFQISGNQVIIH